MKPTKFFMHKGELLTARQIAKDLGQPLTKTRYRLDIGLDPKIEPELDPKTASYRNARKEAFPPFEIEMKPIKKHTGKSFVLITSGIYKND